MAGILAWAADVVGGAGPSDDEADDARASASAAMTPEQRLRAAELDARAASLRRAIQDLRLRVPPPHVAQRLPHLHAHSVASSAALALQLNAHSSTKEQAQQREITLQEENAAYEKAISNCQQKIQEKQMEARLLQSNLKEMEITEHNLKAQLENALMEQEATQHKASTTAPETTGSALLEAESLINIKSKDLEKKKKELELLDKKVRTLEKECSMVEKESLKNPGPAQREKVLEKQLHSLIEQLTSKQSQAEILIADVRAKEKELERLNNLHRNLSSSANEAGAARNRSSRGLLGGLEDYDAKVARNPYQSGGNLGTGSSSSTVVNDSELSNSDDATAVDEAVDLSGSSRSKLDDGERACGNAGKGRWRSSAARGFPATCNCGSSRRDGHGMRRTRASNDGSFAIGGGKRAAAL